MRIYIASSHKTAYKTTKNIFVRTKDNRKWKIFFPEHLGDFSDSMEDMVYIDSICCNKLRESEVLIAVYPFGLSVSVEIGRFLEMRHIYPNQKRYLIVLDTNEKVLNEYNKLKTEAMIIPHIDHIVYTVDELLDVLNNLY